MIDREPLPRQITVDVDQPESFDILGLAPNLKERMIESAKRWKEFSGNSTFGFNEDLIKKLKPEDQERFVAFQEESLSHIMQSLEQPK